VSSSGHSTDNHAADDDEARRLIELWAEDITAATDRVFAALRRLVARYEDDDD